MNTRQSLPVVLCLLALTLWTAPAQAGWMWDTAKAGVGVEKSTVSFLQTATIKAVAYARTKNPQYREEIDLILNRMSYHTVIGPSTVIKTLNFIVQNHPDDRPNARRVAIDLHLNPRDVR